MSSLAQRLMAGRALRGLVDGMVSVILADHLARLGFTPFEVGAIVTATLWGSAVSTILLALVGHRIATRQILLVATALMVLTGVGFAGLTGFWPLLLIAVVGTLNPSAGDVSIFLPAEQAALAEAASGVARTSLFARYNVGGQLAGGIGSLLAGVPLLLVATRADPGLAAGRMTFLLYAVVGLLIGGLYLKLPLQPLPSSATVNAPLRKSRRVVFRLAVLFSLDSFGGGFAVQSLVVLWLQQRFDLSIAVSGQVFFVAGLLAALSQLVSPWLAARIGYVRTMVYTHLPANACLLLAGVVPSLHLAIFFLLLRSALSQMDVPARQAYVMAVVPPDERPAAAGITNVPRSLAAGFAPLLAGWMLAQSSFGWPLVCGGVVKAIYDLLLLYSFREHEPIED